MGRDGVAAEQRGGTPGRDGLERLLVAAGADSRRLRHALALLCDGQWWTLAALVRATATSRRTVEALLRELPLERRGGDEFRIRPAHTPAYQDLLAVAPPPEDPVAHLVPHHAHVLDRLTALVANAPRARHTLDHVSATPETALRRALLLGARFWLPGARLLCVGDHDLTSLAVKLVHPETDVTVVDVDERVLAYIDEQDLGVRTRWADLRLGLPAAAHGHDLAFTDPPYTPEGIGLFVARALEGLADDGRVLLAYGASERTPMLAYKVQQALSELNLAYEAIYPDFNRYFGAEAIGSAADLYFLRPTTRTRPAVNARLSRLTTAIYTQGPQSVESADGGAAAAVPAGFDPDLLVGDWPKELGQPRVKLSTWLAKPYAAAAERVAVALPPGLEAALPRLLLATRAPHVRVVGAGLPPVPDVLAAVYKLSTGSGGLDAVRLPQPDGDAPAVLRRILDNGHAKLANTWREALIALARAQGSSLTKNEARALIREAAPWSDDLTPLDAPLHRLESLPHAVTTTVTALTATTA
ncbi:bis-aminopropyl spermidine synthase family protein [Actinomadura sp. ATCC 31491]|uniref:Bis-aminopropyl spermidine synthase family protein n=1 Tax=Actinomadura luzonensis TaxID=2805427 RepID=A0ABT0G8J9_9ACTN|nr:bis-aminopropyl spermidine synthase family protein [Actinomadura luzonensis]MCK2220915.1 bis-aminopropyl spermidine synthase family protein [Actinomadura luzonensis]